MTRSLSGLPPLLLAAVALAQAPPEREAEGAISDPLEPEAPFALSADNSGGWPENLELETFGARLEFAEGSGIRIRGRHRLTGRDAAGRLVIEIFANHSRLDEQAETVTVEGDVRVFQGNVLQRGDRAVYHYQTGFLDSSGLRLSADPLLLEAGKFTAREVDGRMIYQGEDAGVTTDDVAEPGFWLRARETTVIPGDRVAFRDLRVMVGETPVFWLPYLSQPLDGDLGYHFVPGARSNWGPYLLNSYGLMLGGERDEATGERLDAWLLSRWRVDLYGRRGLGTGARFSDERDGSNPNLTGLGLYYLHDLDPNVSRSGVPRFGVDENRYELQLRQRLGLPWEDGETWRLDANLNLLSDVHYLEDFDPGVYREDPAPDQTLGLYRRSDRTLLSFLARLRLNDFYRSDTRLPQISLDHARAPLPGLSWLQHEGQISFGVLGIEASDFNRRRVIEPLLDLPPGSPQAGRLLNQLQGYERSLATRIRALQATDPTDPRIGALRAQLLDTGFQRFHVYQELSAPFTVGGWLNLTPQIGAGHTHYAAVEGPSGSFGRSLFHLGTEASLQFSRDYGALRRHGLGLDGLLHVIQPYVNWSWLSAGDVAETAPRVDRLTFTTRPRTLSPARFTAIDDLDSWNIVRLGTRQRWLTRRDEQSHPWLTLDTYLDGYIEDPELDRRVSNLYNDLTWQPLPWLAVDVETQFPVIERGSGFNEFATRVRFAPNPDFEFSVGYRLLDNHPVLLDSSRVDLRAYHRIGENWGVGVQQTWEFDDNTLELQQYTLHRDFGSWVAGVGVSQRDNRFKEEFGVVFSLTLKEFPGVNLPFRIDTR